MDRRKFGKNLLFLSAGASVPTITSCTKSEKKSIREIAKELPGYNLDQIETEEILIEQDYISARFKLRDILGEGEAILSNFNGNHSKIEWSFETDTYKLVQTPTLPVQFTNKTSGKEYGKEYGKIPYEIKPRIEAIRNSLYDKLSLLRGSTIEAFASRNQKTLKYFKGKINCEGSGYIPALYHVFKDSQGDIRDILKITKEHEIHTIFNKWSDDEAFNQEKGIMPILDKVEISTLDNSSRVIYSNEGIEYQSWIGLNEKLDTSTERVRKILKEKQMDAIVLSSNTLEKIVSIMNEKKDSIKKYS